MQNSESTTNTLSYNTSRRNSFELLNSHQPQEDIDYSTIYSNLMLQRGVIRSIQDIQYNIMDIISQPINHTQSYYYSPESTTDTLSHNTSIRNSFESLNRHQPQEDIDYSIVNTHIMHSDDLN